MTRDDAKRLLPIIQAYAEGKAIQVSLGGAWVDAAGDIAFMCESRHYRIKPEQLELWAVQYGNGKLSSLWRETREIAEDDACKVPNSRAIRMVEAHD